MKLEWQMFLLSVRQLLKQLYYSNYKDLNVGVIEKQCAFFSHHPVVTHNGITREAMVVFFIYLVKHHRQTAQATCMPVKSSTMNIIHVRQRNKIEQCTTGR